MLFLFPFPLIGVHLLLAILLLLVRIDLLLVGVVLLPTILLLIGIHLLLLVGISKWVHVWVLV